MTILIHDQNATTALEPADPATATWIDPPEAIPLGNHDDPVAASQVNGLIADAHEPTFVSTFSSPAGQRCYLPIYEIATVPIAGQSQRWIELRGAGGDDYQLSVHLSAVARDDGEPVSPPPPMRMFLRYTIDGSTLLRERDFQEVAYEPRGLHAVLALRGPDERDEVYRAFTVGALGAVWIMRRTLTLGVPTFDPPPIDDWHPRGIEPSDWDPDHWEDPRPRPLYRVESRVFEQSIPFTFERDTNANIFAGLTDPPPREGLARRDVIYDGAVYPFYQDSADRRVFYHLPDGFKLCRRATPPNAPRLGMSVAGESVEQAQVTLSYFCAPVTASARLAAAAGQLAAVADGTPVLAPLGAAGARLRLALPGGAADRDGALVDLRAGVRDAVVLPLDAFERVFESLLADGGDLLRGAVRVTPIAAEAPIDLPLSARLEDAVGADGKPAPAAPANRQELLAALIDPAVPATIARTVQVKAPLALFADTGPRSLQSVTVQFESGAAIFLSADAGRDGFATGSARLEVAVADYLVHAPNPWRYRYRRVLTRRDGTSETDATYSVDNTEILIVSGA